MKIKMLKRFFCQYVIVGLFVFFLVFSIITGFVFQIKKINEYNSYFKKLLKIYRLVGNYMQMYVLADFGNRLDYKDAPIDRGREIYEELFEERKLIYDESILEDMLIEEDY